MIVMVDIDSIRYEPEYINPHLLKMKHRYKVYASKPKNDCVFTTATYDSAIRKIMHHDWKCDICLCLQYRLPDGKYKTFQKMYFKYINPQIIINFLNPIL